jgi:hypothetical protein
MIGRTIFGKEKKCFDLFLPLLSAGCLVPAAAAEVLAPILHENGKHYLFVKNYPHKKWEKPGEKERKKMEKTFVFCRSSCQP